MGEYDLCFCEYINENGERSHILASLCNCEAIDDACERLISGSGINSELCDRICNTIEDRLRIPWPHGAKKISPFTFLTILLPIVIYLGSINIVCTFIAYFIALPGLFIICNKIIKKKIKFYTNVCKNVESSKKVASVYFQCFIISMLWTLLSVFLLIFLTMQISSIEFLLLLSLLSSSGTCFIIVRSKGNINLETKILQPYHTCIPCSANVPIEASHCYYCNSCIVFRDHHCMWLQTCISMKNDKWFITGMTFLFNYLILNAYLTFTTVCSVRKITFISFELLVPVHCIDAYSNKRISLATSTGCYSVILAAIVGIVLLHMCYKISMGTIRRPTAQRMLHCKRHFFTLFLIRWYQFWFY